MGHYLPTSYIFIAFFKNYYSRLFYIILSKVSEHLIMDRVENFKNTINIEFFVK